LGFPVHESWANFVLFGGVANPHALFEALLENDIIIRDLAIDGHLRVTAGTESETTEFLDVLARLTATGGPAALGRIGA
jgi:histidinol-phosphate aminotransferase